MWRSEDQCHRNVLEFSCLLDQVGHSIVSMLLFMPSGEPVPPFSVVVKCEFTRSC
jgi:hypothetical protein